MDVYAYYNIIYVYIDEWSVPGLMTYLDEGASRGESFLNLKKTSSGIKKKKKKIGSLLLLNFN